MSLFRGWLRKKHARGYGIHSPFAFDLITNVIHARYGYYAFHDLRQILSENGLEGFATPALNHLSFRLVHYFNAKHILEINAANGVNTCYLTAPASDIHCTCVETDREKVAIARKLQAASGRKCEIVSEIPLFGSQPYNTITENGMKTAQDEAVPLSPQQQYDAIFINLNGKKEVPSIETLLQLSHEKTFWVIYPLKSSVSKQFWRNIVHDERISITFDRKEVGIAFLRFSYHKMHYLV